MERRRFDVELKKLQAREFGDDIVALSELCRFTMFASACGHRGQAIQLTVQNQKIVKWPYGKLKPSLKKEEVATTQVLNPKTDSIPAITAPARQIEIPHQEDEEKTPKVSQEGSEEKSQKTLTRKGGAKPRALKREEKKGKLKKRRSRSSSGYRH